MSRPSTSHAPSTRGGACEPCRAGDHGGCEELHQGTPLEACTCYDDRWEWHEAIDPNARRRP